MIRVIGIGLDGKLSLSTTVLQFIQEAEVLVGSQRHLSYFPEFEGVRLDWHDVLTGSVNDLKKYQQLGCELAILTSGDPLFFGVGRWLLQEFDAQDLDFYPHVSSIQLAFNAIKMPWQDAQVISLHGRSPDRLIESLKRGDHKIAVLTDGNYNPTALIELYLGLELNAQYDCYICQNLGSAEQSILYVPHPQLVEVEGNFAKLNVVIFALAACPSSTINLEDLPVIGLPNQVIASFPDRPGLMTKREIRVIALAQLDLRPHQVIWDIGSGTGSVAIEIARVCPTATIYAIEKTLVGFNLINENRHRFEVTDQVQAVQGAAPAILEHLPDPDRVFIGGSGGNLEAILNMLNTIMGRCTKANKIIVALTTLENLNVSLDWVKRHGCAYELLQIQINKSIPIATSHRLNPQNPVYLITIHSEPSPPPSQ